jgi:aldehyde:ferredoxin oxidoreductase
MCLNDDLASICHCNNLCNEYGLDTISTGATVAFAMECFEHGLVTEEQAGRRLDWGDSGAVAAMTEQLAKGEGPLYDLFGHGVRAALSKLGPDAGRFAMEAGGEELPMHDPRFFPGLGVSYAADATPGRHTVNGSWNLEAGSMSGKFPGVEIKDKYTYSGKGEAHKTIGGYMQAVNAAGLCMFGAFIGPASMLPEYLSLASGRDFSMEEVLAIGERIANLRMAFSVREGVVPARDFKLPGRVLGDPPMAGGPLTGVTVDNDTQVREYFRAMGWDQGTGRPQKECLLRLGLDFAADAGI